MLPHTGDQARSVDEQRTDGRQSVSRPYLSGSPLTLVGIKRRDQVAGSDSAFFVAVRTPPLDHVQVAAVRAAWHES